MRMRNTLIFAAVVLLAAPLALAQFNDGYGNRTLFTEPSGQTRGVPAGTVNDPGSQLLFLLDTGLDAEGLYKNDDNYTSWSVSDYDADNDSSNFQNFVSITNTNPTDSVTVHFRFINSACTDVLDFLVVLSCNDTMLIDPFDYEIPGTTINTKDRFFGSSDDDPIGGIPASVYNDGRFLLFVTASGNRQLGVGDDDNYADWLFPYELSADVDKEGDCDAVDVDTIGDSPSIVENNLHILNASAISFDYLTGFYSTAIPTAFLGGDLPAGANDLAYGVRAWVRPSVDLAGNTHSPDLNWDGDALQAPKGVILAGSEDIPWTSEYNCAVGPCGSNEFYLKSEIQSGIINVASSRDYTEVEGGALSWTLYPIQGEVQGALPSEQFVTFASLIDDYDGSNNIKTLFAPDNSYGMDPATTEFQVLVYNNEEELLELPPPDVPVSPPPPFEPLSLVINVECISTYSLFENQSGSTKFGNFSVADLFSLGGSTVQDFLAAPVVGSDELGPGWVRFDRIETRADQTETADGQNSYFVGGQSIVRFEGFGVSWWLPVSATTVLPEIVPIN